MTNINLCLNRNPFLLKPVGKDYIWGGERLKTEFGKELPHTPLAETWECSTHPDGISLVASGEYEGWTLSELLKLHPQLLGTHPGESGELPILIKFMDAKKDLSIQVHPDDLYARENENGQLGKTEIWYVMDASKDAQVVYGFNQDMNTEMVSKALEDNTIMKYLQKVPAHKNDIFYIESGTVHAICAGSLIAEIQENSNLSYRLYDYDRIDKNGKPRELHIDKALEVMNFNSSPVPKQPMRVLKYQRGAASELIYRCKYFQVERYLLNTERSRELVGFRTMSNSFKVLLCIDGCGVIFHEDGTALNFFKGDCVFVPANSVDLKMHGKAQLLVVGC